MTERQSQEEMLYPADRLLQMVPDQMIGHHLFYHFLSLCAKIASPVVECNFSAKSLTARGVQFYGEEEMKMEKTLRQVCTELKVSRRAVQGYEKAGLVAASGKNKYGHLLYGEPERERIRLVRFYQQLGFQLKEIKELLEADGPVRKATLQAKVAELEKEDIHLRELIRQAKEYIAAL